jgi:hypothetical protein
MQPCSSPRVAARGSVCGMLSIAWKNRSKPPGTNVTIMRAGIPPTFAHVWAIFRGTATVVPGMLR